MTYRSLEVFVTLQHPTPSVDRLLWCVHFRNKLRGDIATQLLHFIGLSAIFPLTQVPRLVVKLPTHFSSAHELGKKPVVA